ncbi:MAG TPA: CvpA family protein [Bryobacteraceae bacterium]|nr:CvpA family protein [Bryobacteraceae bacterium]
MNWFDIAIMAVVVASVASGVCRGFTRSALGAVAFFAAVILGFWFYIPVSFWLRQYIHNKEAAGAVGFGLIFMGVAMVGGIAERISSRLVRSVHLTWLDRILGGAFGLAYGCFMATILVLTFMTFAPRPVPKVVAGSRCFPYFENAAQMLSNATPYEVREGYNRARRDLDTVLPNNVRKEFRRVDF